MHASVIREHVIISNGSVEFKPIRKLDGIDTILNVVIGLSIKTYRFILDNYRPSEIQNFRKKYIDEWRNRFSSIRGVKYKGEPISLDFIK